MTKKFEIPEDDQLLTPAEAAAMFRVNPKTVTRWSQAGKIPTIRTLGGHRRFRRGDVVAILERGSSPATVEVKF